jgi:hypothetical protein
LLIGGTSGDQLATPVAGAVNPATGAWRVLHGFDSLRGLSLSGAALVRGHVYGTGVLSDCPELGSVCQREHAVLLDYDVATDTARVTTIARALSHRPDYALLTVGATASDVVLTTRSGAALRVVRYNVGTGKFTTGPETTCTAPIPYYSQSAWLDGASEYVAGCGATRLAVWTAATNRWTTIDAGSSPLNTRSGSAVVWTGHELFAWSGTVARPGNPTPAGGATIPLG